jgi:hypothetical protein
VRDKILAGTTSYSVPIYVVNSSTGAGLGSLVYNTGSLAGGYRRQGASSWTSISLSSGTLGTWSSGGWIADNPNVAGSYEVGIPNAALASGAAWVEVMYWGAANMAPVLIYIELDAVNYQSATSFVSSVPAVTGAVGSVTGNVGGNVVGSTASVTGAVGSVTGNVGGNVVGSVGSVTGAVGSVTGNVGGSVASVTGNVGGNVSGSVGSISGVTFPSNFGTFVIDSNGYVRLSGPFKINTASGFSFRMVSSSDNKSAYTGGSVSGSRTISGGSSNAVSGSITQIGSTNEYYFSGAQADFNGAEVHFAFTATGANPVYITVNTNP